MNGIPSVEESYGTEFIRKGIHFLSLLIPIIYYFVPRATVLWMLVPLTLLFSLSDAARLLIPSFGRLYSRLFGFLLRTHESSHAGRRLNGATYVLVAASVLIMFLPKVVFITAFSILIISDSSAALIGRRFGRRKFLRKSLQGAEAFFVTALIVVVLSPKIAYIPAEYLIGAVGAAVGTVVEAASFGPDDNLAIPLSVGVVMWALYSLILPSIDVFSLDRLM
jgi:dolichol kinase